ncbi:hypothetical protein G7Y89_g4586 [Cudoniella acicularis]|uniref:Piwi domain-containing protein n=1 Tax=Cudoniella acicularis TaxID=354080 RepID=A0A8H4RPZ3_9HELO|nr:hypothetical protein G7Y89_g4586 [Cudoniella acicularis]
MFELVFQISQIHLFRLEAWKVAAPDGRSIPNQDTLLHVYASRAWSILLNVNSTTSAFYPAVNLQKWIQDRCNGALKYEVKKELEGLRVTFEGDNKYPRKKGKKRYIRSFSDEDVLNQMFKQDDGTMIDVHSCMNGEYEELNGGTKMNSKAYCINLGGKQVSSRNDKAKLERFWYDYLKKAVSNYGLSFKKIKAECGKLTAAWNKLGRPSFVFLQLPPKELGNNKKIYADVKWWGDCDHGVSNVCLTFEKLTSAVKIFRLKDGTLKMKVNWTTMANWCLKINFKNEGTNHAIGGVFPILARVMVVGADVTHPSRDAGNTCPSMGGIVATWDANYAQYLASARLQANKTEGRVSEAHYRDGVSESQFGQVKAKEPPQIKNACIAVQGTEQGAGWAMPSLTFLIVGKRHHARFYPDLASQMRGNVPSGTVVETRVVAPKQFNFYLQSCDSLLGTARSSHYVVVENGSSYSAKDLQDVALNKVRPDEQPLIQKPAEGTDPGSKRCILCENSRTDIYVAFTNHTNIQLLLNIENPLPQFTMTETHLFILEQDGTQGRDLISGLRSAPDGIAVSADHKYVFWTNMGHPGPNGWTNTGSIQRCDIDGKNVTTIIAEGTKTHTPKQLVIAEKSKKLYWCDREGMRVMRCDLNGNNVEALVSNGDVENAEHRKDHLRWCVGIQIDEDAGYVYWTQKGPSKGGKGKILRCPISGAGPNGEDIELLFDGLPEPIDLSLDLPEK